MRTDGFGEKCGSSTSGVSPIRSRSECATPLRTTLPDVDGRAELAEELVNAPREPSGCGVDGRCAVPLDELGFTAAQARELQQVVGGAPGRLLDHRLAPLGAEPVDRAQHETGLARR